MTKLAVAAVTAMALAAACGAALADSAGVVGLAKFPQRDGAGLYAAICQGCHMPDGKGAVGAGAYPALANDPNLANAGYPIYMVVYGQRAMPGFGGFLDDAQVAAIVDYVRTHFGNHYTDAAKAADVAGVRQRGYEFFSLD